MERKNPFNGKSAPPTPGSPAEPDSTDSPAEIADREIPTVPGSMWTVAGYLLLFTLLGFTGYSLFEQKNSNDVLRTELERRAAIIENVEGRVVTTKSQVVTLETELQALERQKKELLDAQQELLEAQRRTQQEAAKAQKSLKDEMRSALESRDVTISELQGNLTLNILDRILFDSGQAVIKPEGEEVLKQIGAVLDQVPNRQIHVMGHTDNIPIRTAHYPSNWELSAARALAAVRFLVDNGGVDPKRIAAVAHGEFQPIANNSTPEGRARNRRITIVVLPEVFQTPEKTIEEPPIKTTANDETDAAVERPESDATELTPVNTNGTPLIEIDVPELETAPSAAEDSNPNPDQ